MTALRNGDLQPRLLKKNDCLGPRQVPKSTSNGRILMVGGSGQERKEFRAELDKLGQEVFEAQSTSQALAALSAQPIDLILIDLLAPEIGGPEFCRILKRDSCARFLPVFVIASSTEVEDEIASINAGADEYLIRPLRPKAVCARVQASLRQRAMIESLDDPESVLFSLAQSVEERDPGIGTHCQRLAVMATAMGITLGLEPDQLLALHRGGYLHDIGKVAIPDRILFKTGPLNAEEWEVMKSHSERGERICSSLRSLRNVLPIIRHHHERWDGTGYPDKLRGEEMPLLARILQLADIYDALTTERSYKAAFSSEEAIRVLKEEAAKGWRDPSLVEMFSDILPMFRTPSSIDLTGISLRSLALSLEQYRAAPPPSFCSPMEFYSGKALASQL